MEKVNCFFETFKNLTVEQKLYFDFYLQKCAQNRKLEDFEKTEETISDYSYISNLIIYLDVSHVSLFKKNQEQIMNVKNALQRHPDVFIDLIAKLQQEASENVDTSGNGENEVQEEVEAAPVVSIY